MNLGEEKKILTHRLISILGLALSSPPKAPAEILLTLMTDTLLTRRQPAASKEQQRERCADGLRLSVAGAWQCCKLVAVLTLNSAGSLFFFACMVVYIVSLLAGNLGACVLSFSGLCVASRNTRDVVKATGKQLKYYAERRKWAKWRTKQKRMIERTRTLYSCKEQY